LSTTWGTTAANATTNTLAEDATASSSHYLEQSVSTTVTNTYTLQAKVKANGRTWVVLYANGAFVGRYFNLSTGELGGSLIGAPDASGSEYMGDGWWKIWITFAASATTGIRLYLATGDGTYVYNGDNASGVYAKEFQLEEASAASPYISTTTVARTITGATLSGNFQDDVHTALETVLETTGSTPDLWKKYKSLV
jgi:hypothetical protein